MTEEQLKDLAKELPVSALRDNIALTNYISEKHLTKVETAHLLTFLSLAMPQFKMFKFVEDKRLTFSELHGYYEKARINFIIIHRVNYLLHSQMLVVYDLLERDNRLRFEVKRLYKKAEKAWKDYEVPRRLHSDKSAWFTLQDHFVYLESLLIPYLEKVYESVRNYMIRLGWRDVEIKARIQIVFFLAKTSIHTFNSFFQDFISASGVDFSACYSSSDMTGIVHIFADMVNALGFETEQDRFNLFDLLGFNSARSQRIDWAWRDFINTLQDEDILDAAAKKAIDLNPQVRSDYERILADEEEKQISKSLSNLGKKYHIRKQSNKSTLRR